MDKKKQIEKLEYKLKELKKSNLDAWKTYGSELCAGDMISEETKLEEKIDKLKLEYYENS